MAAIRHKIISSCCYMKIVITIQLPKGWFSFLRLKISQKPDNVTKLKTVKEKKLLSEQLKSSSTTLSG